MSTKAVKSKLSTLPSINVTPLIDVLLVLLIIFMIISPLKPSRFKTLIPQQPDDNLHTAPNPLTLVVTIDKDLQISLNQQGTMGSINDMGKLSATLVKAFQTRQESHTYRAEFANQTDTPAADKVEKTVFIKAPRSIAYGEVTKVIDVVKGTGANPIGLQIDDLLQ